MRIIRRIGLAAALCLSALPARADKGDVTGTVTLGATVLTDSLTSGKLTTPAQILPVSEFVGAGYFLTDRLRVGMNLQFTEAATEPTPPPPSRFTVFALLPQVNYLFAKPFFVSLVGFVPLRFGGVDQLGFGVQGVIGAGVPIAKDLSLSLAVEVPLVLVPVETLGVTPLVGLAYRL
ncbi:MAG: hypothetical protein ACYCWW_04985 [Deltaproteobacteria bacterium]